MHFQFKIFNGSNYYKIILNVEIFSKQRTRKEYNCYSFNKTNHSSSEILIAPRISVDICGAIHTHDIRIYL